MKFLIIRFKFIGDVLLTSVVAESLRASFPEARIDFLMHDNAAPLFEGNDSIDNVYGLSLAERKNPLRYFSRIRTIAANRYDVIIDASGTSKSEFVSWFSRSAKYRIARAKSGKKGWAYTHLLPRNKLPLNKVSERLAFLKPLIDDGFEIIEKTQPRIALESTEMDSMKHKLVATGVQLDKPIFAIAASAREAHKQWRVERMKDVIHHCLDTHNAQVVLLAGLAHERQQVAELIETMGHPDQVFGNIEVTSIRELAALIAHANLFVGNEGGPRHIADAVGVASLAILSPLTDKAEWLLPDSQRHIGIEWRDIDPNASEVNGGLNPQDPSYQRLYDLIESIHVNAAIDQLVPRTFSS